MFRKDAIGCIFLHTETDCISYIIIFKKICCNENKNHSAGVNLCFSQKNKRAIEYML
jgi:hypothetical protein